MPASKGVLADVPPIGVNPADAPAAEPRTVIKLVLHSGGEARKSKQQQPPHSNRQGTGKTEEGEGGGREGKV